MIDEKDDVINSLKKENYAITQSLKVAEGKLEERAEAEGKTKLEAEKRIEKVKNTAKERIKKAEEAEKDSQEGEGRCRSVSPGEAQPPSLSLSRRRTTSFSISLSLSRRRTTSFSLSKMRRMPSLSRRRRMLSLSRRRRRRTLLILNHSLE